jgi:hypothetical protein
MNWERSITKKVTHGTATVLSWRQMDKIILAHKNHTIRMWAVVSMTFLSKLMRCHTLTIIFTLLLSTQSSLTIQDTKCFAAELAEVVSFFFWAVTWTRGPYCLYANCSTSYIFHRLLGTFFISKRLIDQSNSYHVPFRHCYRRFSISLFPDHIIITADSFLLIGCIFTGLERLIKERNSYRVPLNHWYWWISISLFHFT